MEKLKDLTLNVVGVTFSNSNGSSRQELIAKACLKSRVEIRRDLDNEYDLNAVAVLVDGNQVGFLAGGDAKNMAIMMDNGIQFNCQVAQIGIYKGRNFIKILVSEV